MNSSTVSVKNSICCISSVSNNFLNNDTTILVSETFCQFLEPLVIPKERIPNHKISQLLKRKNSLKSSCLWDLSETWTCQSLFLMILPFLKVFWRIFSQDKLQQKKWTTLMLKAEFQQSSKRDHNWLTGQNLVWRSSRCMKHQKCVTVSCCWVLLRLVNHRFWTSWLKSYRTSQKSCSIVL